MNNPLVSIIIPTYNRRNLLPKAIASVLNQTYQNVEAVVVNDCGEDVSDIVTNFNDSRVRYFSHDVNKGLGAARNTGIRNSLGEWIGYTDDDDRLYTNHVEILLNEALAQDYSVVYSVGVRAEQRKDWKGEYVTINRGVVYNIPFDADMLLYQNITPVLCVMHKKECLDKAGLFDEDLSTYEDWLLWLRMSRNYPFLHINRATCEYTWRTDGSTMSSSRNGFQTNLPYIYHMAYEYCKDKPHILKIQDEILERAKMERIPENS